MTAETTFFDTLFGATEHTINVRAIGEKGSVKNDFVWGGKEVLRFAKENEDLNIFFGIATRKDSGEKEGIAEVVSCHVDIDYKQISKAEAEKALSEFPLYPTIINDSGEGMHCYWVLREPGGQDIIPAVEATNRALAKALHGDKGACDASRILRVPGSINHKYGHKPVVKVRHIEPNKKYSLTDFASVLTIEPKETKIRRKKPSLLNLIPEDCIEETISRCAKLNEILIKGVGERHLSHDERIYLASVGRAFHGGYEWAVREVFQHLSDYNEAETFKQFASLTAPPVRCSTLCPEGQCEAMKALGKKSPVAFGYVVARERGKNGVMEIKSFTTEPEEVPFPKEDPPAAEPEEDVLVIGSGEDETPVLEPGDPHTNATEFRNKEYKKIGGFSLHHYQGEFYRWERTKYSVVSDQEIRNDIWDFLSEAITPKNESFKPTSRRVSDTLDALKAVCSFPHNKPIPYLFDGKHTASDMRNLISVKNGIFDVNTGKLIRHTPLFFNLASVPYPYNPDAKCPLFDRMLEDNLPDKEHRRHLLEFYGYCLVHDTSLEVFLLKYGPAGTGKSASCAVLQALVGTENVSAVSLEAFSETRTFPLAPTIGKLINVSEEIGEIDKAAEGLLKKFVSGGVVSIERKYRDAVTVKPTARLIFATNTRPRWADRTDGVYRRLMLFPFTHVIHREKQDGRFREPSFWTDSGEMPGIFLRALEGLHRLRKRGKFLVPEQFQREQSQYQRENNPTAEFLRDYVEADPGSKIPNKHLTIDYQAYMKDLGHKPLGSQKLGEEIRNLFPEAVKSDNAHYLPDGIRDRVWTGIKMISR